MGGVYPGATSADIAFLCVREDHARPPRVRGKNARYETRKLNLLTARRVRIAAHGSTDSCNCNRCMRGCIVCSRMDGVGQSPFAAGTHQIESMATHRHRNDTGDRPAVVAPGLKVARGCLRLQREAWCPVSTASR